MNDAAITLVQSSWQHVAVIAPQAAQLFYNNLFAADPSLKALFKGSMDEQGRKLMQMIGIAVAKLREVDELVPVLKSLGRRHATYGVKPAHYNTVAAALLKTLEQGLGEKFTPPVKQAWTDAYQLMAATMIEAAQAAA